LLPLLSGEASQAVGAGLARKLVIAFRSGFSVSPELFGPE
jgi:hypothetical protein